MTVEVRGKVEVLEDDRILCYKYFEDTHLEKICLFTTIASNRQHVPRNVDCMN